MKNREFLKSKVKTTKHRTKKNFIFFPESYSKKKIVQSGEFYSNSRSKSKEKRPKFSKVFSGIRLTEEREASKEKVKPSTKLMMKIRERRRETRKKEKKSVVKRFDCETPKLSSYMSSKKKHKRFFSKESGGIKANESRERNESLKFGAQQIKAYKEVLKKRKDPILRFSKNSSNLSKKVLKNLREKRKNQKRKKADFFKKDSEQNKRNERKMRKTLNQLKEIFGEESFGKKEKIRQYKNVEIRWDDAKVWPKYDEELHFGHCIGQGSFAKVYEGIDKLTQETVAIKVIDKRKIVNIRKRELVQKEISILSKVSHPNIVKFKRMVEDKKRVVIYLNSRSSW